MSYPSPGLKPTNVRWMIVLLLMGLAFLAHFNRMGISVAGNEHFITKDKQLEPDKLTAAEMGLVYSAFLLVYTIGMLPGGWLIDRIGPRWAMTGMGLGLGFCAAMTGVLGWLGFSIAGLLLPLLVIRGIAGGTSVPLHPGAARSVSLWVPLKERSTANGLITAGALVGIALTYPIFGWLIEQLGWPSAFVLAGATLMLFAVLWYSLSADSPASHRWSNDAERELVAGGEEIAPRARATFRDFLQLFRNRSLVLLTLSYGTLSYVQYMFFYWIGYYFEKVLEVSRTESRAAAFTITMSMAVGMALGGWVSDRLCRWLGLRTGCRVMALSGMSLTAGFSLLGIYMTDPQMIVVCFSLAFGSLGLCEGIFWTMAPTLEKRNGGLACALLNTGGNGLGLLAPILTPILGEAYGWNSAVVVACIICGIGGLLWFGITPAPETEASLETEPEVW